MRQIVYISASHDRAAPLGAEAILDASRRNNAAEGITGALIFADGHFFQVLEGDAGSLGRRLEIIRRDTRHSNVLTLLDRDIEKRMFPDWSMGWHNPPPDHPITGRVREIAARGEATGGLGDETLLILIDSILRSVPV